MGMNPDAGSDLQLVPSGGELRFVEKTDWLQGEVDNHGTPALRRILQRYEWSYTDSKWDWYDVPLVQQV